MRQKLLLTFFLFFLFVANSCTDVRLKEWKEVDRAIKNKLENFPLPKKVTLDLLLTQISRDENTVIYKYKFNETICDFQEMKEHLTYEEMKNAISSDAETDRLMSFLKKKGMDIKLKFVGDTSLKSFEIKVYKDEY